MAGVALDSQHGSCIGGVYSRTHLAAREGGGQEMRKWEGVSCAMHRWTDLFLKTVRTTYVMIPEERKGNVHDHPRYHLVLRSVPNYLI